MRAIVSLALIGSVLAAVHPSKILPPATRLSPSSATAPATVCTPPDESTAGWRVEYLKGAMIKVPLEYSGPGNEFNAKVFSKGARSAVLHSWVGLGGKSQTSSSTVSSCQLTLGGRTAEIKVFQGGNRIWLATATWDVMPDGRSFEAYVMARYPSDLIEMRAILWSVQFPGYDAVPAASIACGKPAPPATDVADVLDTGIVTMMAGQSAPPIGPGSVTLEFSFDSSGALLPLDVTESDLPDAAIKRVALLVGSNVKPQSPGAPRAAVRIMFTPAGVVYKAVPASACPTS